MLIRLDESGYKSMERSFVARNLRRCISYSDIRSNTALHTEDGRQQASKRSALSVDDSNVFKDSINQIIVKSKPAYNTKTIEQSLLLKLLSKNIKDTYNIRVRNRNFIVQTLISFLKESSPYHIHRFDIKSFYESIDRTQVLKTLRDDGKLSKKNIILIELLFKELSEKRIPGIPRGIGLSATLSELVLKGVDEKIQQTKGIFYYARFVDDIIAITDTNHQQSDIKQAVESALPAGLELHGNGEKIYFERISKSTDKTTTKRCRFDYLGYGFDVKESNHESEKFLDIKRRKLEIGIAKGKQQKIKSRIIRSFTKYISSKTKTPLEYDLLIKRLKFLSGNYSLHNLSDINTVKSGIYYNYSLINKCTELKELDRFLKSILFNSNYKLSRRIQRAIPIHKRRDIAHFSFISGHKSKRTHRFSYQDFKEIKQAWL